MVIGSQGNLPNLVWVQSGLTRSIPPLKLSLHTCLQMYPSNSPLGPSLQIFSASLTFRLPFQVAAYLFSLQGRLAWRVSIACLNQNLAVNPLEPFPSFVLLNHAALPTGKDL